MTHQAHPAYPAHPAHPARPAWPAGGQPSFTGTLAPFAETPFRGPRTSRNFT